jgi:hypothetical protein
VSLCPPQNETTTISSITIRKDGKNVEWKNRIDRIRGKRKEGEDGERGKRGRGKEGAGGGKKPPAQTCRRRKLLNPPIIDSAI